MKHERYLLDTNICAFILRGRYDLDKKLKEVGIDNCFVSEITVAELLYGAVWSGSDKNLKLTKKFCNKIEVLPIYDNLMEYAKQKSELRRQGLLIDDFDLLIGCTAIVNDLILVTDNVKHFNRLPVEIQNWVER